MFRIQDVSGVNLMGIDVPATYVYVLQKLSVKLNNALVTMHLYLHFSSTIERISFFYAEMLN